MGSKDKAEYYIDRKTRRNYEKGESETKKRYQKKFNGAGNSTHLPIFGVEKDQFFEKSHFL